MSKGSRLILIVSVVLFIGSTAWNVGTRVTTQTETVSSIETVVQALETTCLEDRARDAQYKVRGEDVAILAEDVLLQTHTSIAGLEAVQIPPPRETVLISRFRSTIPDLEQIIRSITILPLPDCEARANRLRKQLPPG